MINLILGFLILVCMYAIYQTIVEHRRSKQDEKNEERRFLKRRF